MLSWWEWYQQNNYCPTRVQSLKYCIGQKNAVKTWSEYLLTFITSQKIFLIKYMTPSLVSKWESNWNSLNNYGKVFFQVEWENNEAKIGEMLCTFLCVTELSVALPESQKSDICSESSSPKNGETGHQGARLLTPPVPLDPNSTSSGLGKQTFNHFPHEPVVVSSQFYISETRTLT